MRSHYFAHRIGVILTIGTAVWVLSPDMLGGVRLSGGSEPRVFAAPSAAPDALLAQQWHLMDRTVEVAGANVRNAWPTSLGAGIVIGIVDDGLQYTHPDLSPNYLASASWDFISNDSDPYPTGSRGTAVAGIAAARGDNTIGVSGAAPQASLAGLRLAVGTPTDSQESAAFNFLPQVIHILNNAWNPSDNGSTLKGPGPLAKAARQSAITNGRSGKGRVFVWPAGDGRLNSDDCNFDGYANSRFVIAVGAMDDTGYASSQTERCAALMVMAASGLGSRALTTTDLLGSAGYETTDYTGRFGTSSTGGGPAATGTVSGAAALMLSRNPNLGWRDVQEILRRTSVRISPTDPEWTSGPFPHSHRFGFGLIDAKAAVDMAGAWTNLPAEEALTPQTRQLNVAIPDTSQTGITDTITISSNEANFVVEHVEIDFNATHPWRGDITVALTSPSGVTSALATVRPNDFNDNFTNWTFGSVRHWGESAAGAWTLRVADVKFRDTGTWGNWTLRIYGYHGGQPSPGAFARINPASGSTGLSTSPTLSWGQSSAATSYEYCIHTSNNSACNATWTSTGANTSAALSGLSANTIYYWHVRAINGTGTTYANGNATTFWNFTTAAAPPGAFVHSSPANGATGQSMSPTLGWTASSGATTYEYCYDTSHNNACNATWISVGSATSVGLSGLAANTLYSWHVRATNAGGTRYAEADPAAFWSFTTAVPPPGAFSHSSPANGATGQTMSPTLSWTTSSGATGYEYCYDTSNNSACNGTWTSAGGATSVGLSGLTPGTAYYWHVRASNTAGSTYAEGSAGAFWSLTTATPGPFGQVDTPSQNASGIQGALGITGWTLDDIGVTKVEVFRNCLGGFDTANCQPVLGQNLVYIGDASFVPGARPDIEAAYPTYPFANRAGWGYLILSPLLPHVTNSEPYGGQGAITLYVIATDTSGNKKILGRSSDPSSPSYSTPTSVTLNNDANTKPFGGIDTPAQGQVISGSFNNFGWALTPDSNTTGGQGNDILVPTSGSTITVYIDGVPVSTVAYNQCRGNVGNPPPAGVYCNDDVSNIFGNSSWQPPLTTRTSNPTKFRNLDAGRGAIGAYSINTTSLTNGLHTIEWAVADSADREAGIGSRYFTVSNGGPQPLSAASALIATETQVVGEIRTLDGLTSVADGVFGRTGFSLAEPWTKMHANSDGTYAVRLPEMGRLELWLGSVEAGYLIANDTLRALPVGSTLLDTRFAWMPPAGYVGPYHLTFVRGGARIDVTVTVVEKPRVIEGEAQVRMHLDAAVRTERGVRLDGWAFDPHAAIGSGIGAVHVWATPVEINDGRRWGAAPAAASPFFVGSATLDQLRSDLALLTGGAPKHAGFSSTATLAPGRYVLTAYVWNARTARWEDARSVTVDVR